MVEWSWYDPKRDRSNGHSKGREYYYASNLFGMEEVLERLYEDEELKGIPKKWIRDACYLQFFMLRQVIKAQWWYSVRMVYLGKFWLRIRKVDDLKWDMHYKRRNFKKNYYADKFECPFLKYPREVRTELNKEKFITGHNHITIGQRKKNLKHYRELGQRYYVLDNKPTT